MSASEALVVIADRVSDLPVLAGAHEAILANAMTPRAEMGEPGYAALSAEVAITLKRLPSRQGVPAIAIRR